MEGEDQKHSELISTSERLKAALKRRGWTQEVLAAVTGKSEKAINELVRGKSSLTKEMAGHLAAAFNDSIDEWVLGDTLYRLSLEPFDGSDIARRARVFEFAPVFDMQRRGWLVEGNDISRLERELCDFFEIESLSQATRFAATSFRRGTSIVHQSITPSERAWSQRALQLAKTIPAEDYDESRLPDLLKRLHKLAAFPQEARKIAAVLAEYGIRLVVVEPLPGMKVDGAALWIDDKKPVIAMSIQADRIDNFWFTLFHELAHIARRDYFSFDVDLSPERESGQPTVDPAEIDANSRAREMLIPKDEIDSFIQRVSPLYSKQRISQFANRVKIHPGIIIGQLQHRGEVGFFAHREFLVKIREFAIQTTLTDGWGRTLPV